MSYLTALLALWLQTTTPDSNLNSLVEQIEEVTVRGDVAALDRHAETLERWLQHEGLSNRELCLYTVAYAKWRLAYLPGHEAIAERKVLLRDAESYYKPRLFGGGPERHSPSFAGRRHFSSSNHTTLPGRIGEG